MCVCVCVCRSVGELPVCAEFDCGLLEDTDWLTAGELVMNELTVEGIQHKSVHPST